LAIEDAGDAAADKAGALPTYSTAVGQLQRAEDDAARQGASLANLNPQQVCPPPVPICKQPLWQTFGNCPIQACFI
jgi:hypothetical protein